MENGLSASDVALMSRNGDGFGLDGGWGGMFGLLVLLAIMNGGFGGWGNNGGFDNRWATTQDVNNAQQFGQLLDGNRDIMSQANNNTNNIVNAINQSEYETIASMKDAQLQLQDRLSSLAVGQADTLARLNETMGNARLENSQQTACINQNLMQNRYEAALNTAAINDTTTAQTQKILDALAINRMADMQNQINQLQLAQATSGLLRFPNQYSFPIYAPPFTQPYPTVATTTTTAG